MMLFKKKTSAKTLKNAISKANDNEIGKSASTETTNSIPNRTVSDREIAFSYIFW